MPIAAHVINMYNRNQIKIPQWIIDVITNLYRINFLRLAQYALPCRPADSLLATKQL